MWARGARGVLGAGAGAAAAAAALTRLPPRPEQRESRRAPPPPSASKPLRCDEASLRAAAATLLTPMVQYAELHGLLYADKDTSADPSLTTQCPVAMLPFQIPRQAFDESVALSPLWNQLVDAIARDRSWLYGTLDKAALADPFTAELMKLSKAVHAEGLRQPLMLGIHRSDYMLHEPEGSVDPPRFLQVELNTIASSMLSHSSNTSRLHRYMLDRYGSMPQVQEHFGVCGSELSGFLPENHTLREVPAALAQAHRAYGAKEAAVLFVVQDGERNFADQRWVEYALFERHAVPVLRRTLTELHAEASMDARTGRLRLAGGEEISVVYYRSGYSPDDYYSQKEWDARLTLEKSLAVKCPSVDYQLVGAKKVQQALARPGAVERFIGNDEGAKLRTCFAGLWGLGPGEDDKPTLAMAFAQPHLYVLKPQREGGGNNFYGQDVATKLRELTVEERGAYILMQRILPRLQDTVMTRGGRATIMPGLSEFGFYSVFLGDGRNAYLSRHAGHLVRTKGEGVDEGGVAAGYAVISSPFLVQ